MLPLLVFAAISLFVQAHRIADQEKAYHQAGLTRAVESTAREIELYINGLLVKTGLNHMVSGATSNNTNLYIGRRGGRTDRNFKGTIDLILTIPCIRDYLILHIF